MTSIRLRWQGGGTDSLRGVAQRGGQRFGRIAHRGERQAEMSKR
jgi:hypothetical protein